MRGHVERGEKTAMKNASHAGAISYIQASFLMASFSSPLGLRKQTHTAVGMPSEIRIYPR